MNIRGVVIDLAKGDYLGFYWKMFEWRRRITFRPLQDVVSFFLHRSARRHGGYIGRDAVFDSVPVLPHGLQGIYISRYAHIGAGCCIYQNVTIGEVNRAAPRIGNRCLIGAGAVVAGGIRIGDDVRIGAGAVVASDIPDHATVVAQPSRIIIRGGGHG